MSHIVPEDVASAMSLGPQETMLEFVASSDFAEGDVVWERPE